MGKIIKDYINKQFQDVKANPKCLLTKWWFWFIIIFYIFAIFRDNSQYTNTITSSNNISNEIVENIVEEETQEERVAREERERKKAEEKAEKERQKNIEDTKWSLYATTEQVIKNRLKSPSTAKFSNQKAVYDEKTKTYKVQGDVDSQNSFGAMIRSRFYAEYNDQLEIKYLTFDGEVWLDNR